MTVYKNVPSGFYLKSRPKAYKAKDAAYTTGGNKGTVLSRVPKKYPLNSQQRKVKDCAARCGIRKGMSKVALQKAMVDCVPTCFGKTAARKD